MELLAGTRQGLYRLGAGSPELLADGDVSAVTVDDGTVWAVVDDTTLVRGGPGVSGTFGFEPVARHDRALRCLLAVPGGLLAGTAEAGLVRLDGDRLVAVEGFQGVPGRGDWYTPWGGPPDTRSLAAARAPGGGHAPADSDGAGGTWYANVHVGGVPRSTDGGATWQPTIDVDDDVHQVVTAGGLVLVAAAYGLAVSDDAGATWRWRTDGLHARYARAVTVAGDTVLVSVSQGPGGGRAAVYRGEAALDGSLTRCRDGLPEWFTGNVDTGCLTADGTSVALADADRVYRSADAGRSWHLLVEGLPAVRWLEGFRPDTR